MPIYQYECDNCKGIIEKIQPVPGEAPICCNSPMRKLPTAHSFFKMKGMGGYPSLRKATQGSKYDRSEGKQWV